MTRRKRHWLGAVLMLALAASLMFYPMPDEIGFSDLMCGAQAFSAVGAVALIICGHDESLARGSWGMFMYGLTVIAALLTVIAHLLMLIA